MKRATLFAVSILIVPTHFFAARAQAVLDGTWKLVSTKRTNVATGDATDTLGPNPQGFFMYGRDGRMMVIEARSDRPMAESIDKISEQQRSQLFAPMLAYSGTYKF